MLTTTTAAGSVQGTLERLDEDNAPTIIEPWVLLPSQAVDGTRAASASGERRLMAAVLTDAIQVYLKGRRQSLLFREAERWIESSDRGWLLSFENVCDVLQIDAGLLRRALHRYAASGAPPIPVDMGRLRVARGRKIRI